MEAKGTDSFVFYTDSTIYNFRVKRCVSSFLPQPNVYAKDGVSCETSLVCVCVCVCGGVGTSNICYQHLELSVIIFEYHT